MYLPCVSYHLPTTDVRLFSPQVYHQLHGGHSVVTGDAVTMLVRNKSSPPITITIPIDKDCTNLPVVHDSFVSQKAKRQHASKFRSALNATGIYAALDYFANVSTKIDGGHLSASSRLQGLFSSHPVSVVWPMRTFRMLRRNYSSGIGVLGLACSAFKQ